MYQEPKALSPLEDFQDWWKQRLHISWSANNSPQHCSNTHSLHVKQRVLLHAGVCDLAARLQQKRLRCLKVYQREQSGHWDGRQVVTLQIRTILLWCSVTLQQIWFQTMDIHAV